MNRKLVCPFCGGIVHIVPCDDEGNYPKDSGYEANPWSGLGYLICHEESDVVGDCPIAREDGDGMLGRFIYDSPEDAAELWYKYKS